MSEAPSDLVARYMNGHSLRKCLGNILASSRDVLRETIPTIPVLLFLIIIGDQFGQRKFLIKDLACVSDMCGNHGERGLGTRLLYPRGRRIIASPSSRVVFFAATLPPAWPLCTCLVFGCCSCSNIDFDGQNVSNYCHFWHFLDRVLPLPKGHTREV